MKARKWYTGEDAGSMGLLGLGYGLSLGRSSPQRAQRAQSVRTRREVSLCDLCGLCGSLFRPGPGEVIFGGEVS